MLKERKTCACFKGFLSVWLNLVSPLDLSYWCSKSFGRSHTSILAFSAVRSMFVTVLLDLWALVVKHTEPT